MHQKCAVVLAIVALTGCASAETPVEPIPGSALSHTCDSEYAAAPFGDGEGEVLRPMRFTGYARPLSGLGEDNLGFVDTCELYNPNGDDVFEEGSPFGAGKQKPRALLINLGALWCQPCLQLSHELPSGYQPLADKGVEFLFALDEDLERDPATVEHLDSWISTFDLPYPAVLDSSKKLAGPTNSQHPATVIVDLRTMRIVRLISGTFTYASNGEVFDQLETIAAE